MCRNSCLVTTAYIFLTLALLACLLSYVAPFWIRFSQNNITTGLWATCDHNSGSCRWFWEGDLYAVKHGADWFKAAIALFGIGLILVIVGFVLATLHVCCRCCKESFSIGSVIGTFVVTGTICIVVGIGVYAGVLRDQNKSAFDSKHLVYDWAFYIGVAGALLALVSGILFFCRGRCGRSHTRVV